MSEIRGSLNEPYKIVDVATWQNEKQREQFIRDTYRKLVEVRFRMDFDVVDRGVSVWTKSDAEEKTKSDAEEKTPEILILSRPALLLSIFPPWPLGKRRFCILLKPGMAKQAREWFDPVIKQEQPIAHVCVNKIISLIV